MSEAPCPLFGLADDPVSTSHTRFITSQHRGAVVGSWIPADGSVNIAWCDVHNVESVITPDNPSPSHFLFKRFSRRRQSNLRLPCYPEVSIWDISLGSGSVCAHFSIT